MKVYVAIVQHVDDDWKRAEKSCDSLGVFMNKQDAYKVLFEHMASFPWEEFLEDCEEEINKEFFRTLPKQLKLEPITWKERFHKLQKHYKKNNRDPEYLKLCAGYEWIVFKEELL